MGAGPRGTATTPLSGPSLSLCNLSFLSSLTSFPCLVSPDCFCLFHCLSTSIDLRRASLLPHEAHLFSPAALQYAYTRLSPESTFIHTSCQPSTSMMQDRVGYGKQEE